MEQVISNLKAIHVKELLKKRDLLAASRLESKFIIPLDKLKYLSNFLKTRFYYSHFGHGFEYDYHNTYLDTANYQFFHCHRQGKANRLKIRIREYKNGIISRYLECKEKTKGITTNKQRVKIDQQLPLSALINHQLISQRQEAFRFSSAGLTETTEVFYQRVNLVAVDFSQRITLDFNLYTKKNCDKLALVPGYVILEAKSTSYPKELARYLRRYLKVYEQSFSKYCVSACHLNPDLRRNNWKAIFKNYF
jgi:hypothetical protein